MPRHLLRWCPAGVTLALLLVLGSAAPAPLRGVSTARADDAADQIAFVQDILAAANAYWAGQFRTLGRAYQPPKLILARHGMAMPSPCDEDEPEVEHSYCDADQTITLDVDSDGDDTLVSEGFLDAPLAVVWLVTHELSHHVQNLLGLNGLSDFPSNVRYELQADCLAGVVTQAYARAQTWVEEGDLDGAVDKIIESADPNDIPAQERDHGTAAQRVRAFLRGYEGAAPVACDVPSR